MAATTAVILYRGQGAGALSGQRLLAVGGILNPTGSAAPAVVSDYNFPASPWARTSRSLPPETRRKVARALYEATIEDRKQKPARKPKRRPARPSEVDKYELPTARAHVRSFGSVPVPEPARTLVTPPPKVIGQGRLRGDISKFHNSSILQPAGGARGQLRARRVSAHGGRLRPQGIENLTDEQLLQLLEEAA